MSTSDHQARLVGLFPLKPEPESRSSLVRAATAWHPGGACVGDFMGIPWGHMGARGLSRAAVLDDSTAPRAYT